MAFYIRLNYDEEIELPTDLELDERMKLCEDIIEKYPDQFRYVMPKNSKDANIVGNQASMRLEIMGSYILDASKDKSCHILSEYKEKRIRSNEINMSELENRKKM